MATFSVPFLKSKIKGCQHLSGDYPAAQGDASQNTVFCDRVSLGTSGHIAFASQSSPLETVF